MSAEAFERSDRHEVIEARLDLSGSRAYNPAFCFAWSSLLAFKKTKSTRVSLESSTPTMLA